MSRYDRRSVSLQYNNFEKVTLTDPGDSYVTVYDCGNFLYDTLTMQNKTDQEITLEFEDYLEPATKHEMPFAAGEQLSLPFIHGGLIRAKAAAASSGKLTVAST